MTHELARHPTVFGQILKQIKHIKHLRKYENFLCWQEGKLYYMWETLQLVHCTSLVQELHSNEQCISALMTAQDEGVSDLSVNKTVSL